MNRVVFHIDEMQAWSKLFPSIQGLLEEDLDNLKIYVLANKIAVRAYTRDEYSKNIEQFNKDGVIFAACNRALNSQNISPDNFISKNIQVAPNGVAALISKQNDDYAYIKV